MRPRHPPGAPGEAEEKVIRQPEGAETDLIRTLCHCRDLGPAQKAAVPGLLEVQDNEADLERSPACIDLYDPSACVLSAGFHNFRRCHHAQETGDLHVGTQLLYSNRLAEPIGEEPRAG